MFHGLRCKVCSCWQIRVYIALAIGLVLGLWLIGNCWGSWLHLGESSEGAGARADGRRLQEQKSAGRMTGRNRIARLITLIELLMLGAAFATSCFP
jgi:hypothetical protein